MSSLGERHRQPELMDDPDLDPELHRQALAGLRRVHWISGTVTTLLRPIRNLAGNRPVRVLDVACGGGAVAIDLAKRARNSGLTIEVSGCDISSTALEVAAATATDQQVDVHFFEANAIRDALPSDYDVVCCSLFLHHLDDEDAVRLMKSMKQATRQMVLISDLVRSNLGFVMTWCGIRLLTRSHICHADGPASVRAAFTPDEMKQLAERAVLTGATLSRHWPQRMLLQWSRS